MGPIPRWYRFHIGFTHHRPGPPARTLNPVQTASAPSARREGRYNPGMNWLNGVKNNFDTFEVKLAENGFMVEFTYYDLNDNYRTRRIVMSSAEELMDFVKQAQAFKPQE